MADRNRAALSIVRKKNLLARRGFDLGASRGDLVDAGYGGFYQVFVRGRIYWHHTTGSHEVHGGILDTYLRRGGHDRNPRTGRRELGFPKTDETRTSDGKYPVSRFEWGEILWAHGGVALFGDFYTPWKRGLWRSLGYPTGDPQTSGNVEGVLFEKGWLLRGRRTRALGRGHFTGPKLGKPDIVVPDVRDRLGILLTCSLSPELWEEMGESAASLTSLLSGRVELRPVGGSGRAVALEPEVVSAFDPSDVSDGGDIDPEWPTKPGTNLPQDVQVRLGFRLASGAELADRTLYDVHLVAPTGRRIRLFPHALYAKESWSDFGVIHATDLHVSRRLDTFRKRLERVGRRESAREYVNWNDMFRDLIREANRRHDAGEVDLIVATGDLVDYIYEAGDSKRGGGNFAFLEELVLGRSPYPDQNPSPHEELRVPIFTTLGNHDYRPEAYELFFDVDVPVFSDPTMRQYAGHNLTEDDARALQGGRKPTLSRDRSLAMVKPRTPGYYFREIGDGSYTVKLGRHRLVMIDTGPDADILSGTGDAIEHWLGWSNEDEESFASGSPNSRGVNRSDVTALRRALDEAGRDGLVLVGMHAPPLNPKGSQYPHYLRETEHPAADSEEIVGFLERRDPYIRILSSPTPGRPWEQVPDKDTVARRRHPSWFHDGAPFFKTGTTGDLLDSGVARGETPKLLELCAGVGTDRPVDLVLFGHIHRHVEFRLEWDAAQRELRYHMDLYTENPGRYYKSWENGQSEPVHVRVDPRTTSPRSRSYRDRRPGAVWREWRELLVPAYERTLDAARDAKSWWSEHRPLLIQSAPLGPVESNQREDLEQNPQKPGPTLRGVRCIRVEDDVITRIHRLPADRLGREGISGTGRVRDRRKTQAA